MTHGHCLCGGTSWDFEGPALWTGFCHCASCRRNCAAPVTAFIGVPSEAWRWTGQTPSEYRSSDHATRYFCPTCGTPVAYASTRFPDEMHFYVAGLADPASCEPIEHFYRDEQLPWLHLACHSPQTTAESEE